jgi:hypothetical protein
MGLFFLDGVIAPSKRTPGINTKVLLYSLKKGCVIEKSHYQI